MGIPTFVWEVVKNPNPKNTKVCLDSSGLYDDELKELCDLLNKNPYVTELHLDTNNLTDNATLNIANLQYITKLSLVENNITDDGIFNLRKNKLIKELDLRTNCITDQGAKLFLEGDFNYTYLNLAGNKISSYYNIRIAALLKTNNSKKEESLLKNMMGVRQDAPTHLTNGGRSPSH